MKEELQKPFEAKDLEWRVQRSMNTKKGPKAIVVPYIQNRAIMNRLDEVFGPGKWRNEYVRWGDKGVLCGISVKVDNEWVTKWDGAEETNIESIKGGLSASMKRTAVQWGIGRYLYDLDEVWVDIKDRGENYIKDGKNNIQGYWDTPNIQGGKAPKKSTPVTPQAQPQAEPAPQTPPQQQEKAAPQKQSPAPQAQTATSASANDWNQADIDKLKELKQVLGITDNSQLNPFVSEFLDTDGVSWQNITPTNIKAFNIYLSKKAETM